MSTVNKTLNEISVSYSKKNFYNEKIITSLNLHELIRKIYSSSECIIDFKEYFFIILLNRNNLVIGYNMLSAGGISGTVVDIRIAFAIALKSLATSMVIVHNHPSGNLKPSQQDITITKQFKDAGRIMDIAIIDHIIIADSGYFSFADQGML